MKSVRFYDAEPVAQKIREIEKRVRYFDHLGDKVVFKADEGIAYEGDWICWNEYGSFVMTNEEYRRKVILNS